MLCVYILAGMLNLEGYKVAILAIESLLAQVFPRSQGFARRVRYRRLMPIASGAAQTKLQDPSLPSRYSPSQPKWAPCGEAGLQSGQSALACVAGIALKGPIGATTACSPFGPLLG